MSVVATSGEPEPPGPKLEAVKPQDAGEVIVRIEPAEDSWDEFDRITYDDHTGRPDGDVIIRPKHRGDPL
jgi:hypothetical protein